MYYFYVLQSQKNKNWFYKGSSGDLRKRFRKHNRGEVISSKLYRPLKLVYYEAYLIRDSAIKREMSIKKSGSVWIPLLKRIKRSIEKNPR